MISDNLYIPSLLIMTPSFSTQTTRYAHGLFFILSFLIPTVLAANFTLNHFYSKPYQYFQDSSWFAYLITHATHWPLQNPLFLRGSVFGENFFQVHFSLIFYLYSAFYTALSGIGIVLPPAVFFSLVQGSWFGIFSLASYSLLLPCQQSLNVNRMLLAFIFALFVMFNGVSLAILAFYHFEIAIPAFFLAFFALWGHSYKKLCYVPLILGLITREDAGLHYFGAFILLALAFHFMQRYDKSNYYTKYFLFLALACMAYALTSIIVQNFFFGTTTFENIYWNTNNLPRNTSFFIQRLDFIRDYRSYIYVPWLLLLVLAFSRRDIFQLLGCLFALPWMIFSFFAASSKAGTLGFHYAFPLLITLLWPAILYRISQVVIISRRSYFSYWSDVSSIVLLSALLFFGNHQSIPDNNVRYLVQTFSWKAVGFQWMTYFKNY